MPNRDRNLLRERIYNEYPALRNREVDDWSRVTCLRQWAWSHVNHSGGNSNLVDTDPKIPWLELDAPAIFQLYANDRGGSYCGGTAHALRKLYEMFGYGAWTVNSGPRAPTLRLMSRRW